MSRDYEPEAAQWYEDLDTEETFQVLSVDPDEEIVRIQWLDREVQEIDLDAWNEMDLELAAEPEGWVDDPVPGEEDDEDDDEDDWEEDEEEDEEEEEEEDEDDWTTKTTTTTRTTITMTTTTNSATASDGLPPYSRSRC